jgi:putative lipoprotein
LRFAPNAYRTYVPVTLIRANLSEDKDDSIRLVLNLVGKDKLGTRLTKNNTVKITFNNVLSKPDFWEVMESYWGLGAFTKNKYRKLLAYYDSNESTIRDIIEGSDVTAQGYLYQHVQEVIAYFAAHPDEL